MIFQDLWNVIRVCTCNNVTSDDQEWNGDEDNAPVHCGRGPAVAWLTTASDNADEAKARTEAKVAMEMVYMVKRTLRQRVVALMEGSPSFYTCARAAWIDRLAEKITHVPSMRMNAYSHCDTLTWRCDRCINGRSE